MSKSLGVTAVGNTIVDISVHRDKQYFQDHGFELGSSELVSEKSRLELLKEFKAEEEVLSSGGSIANTVDIFVKGGGAGAVIGRVGDDRYGDHFLKDLRLDGVRFQSSMQGPGNTGVSVVMVSPDGERTMRTSLGVAAELSGADVDDELIAASRWVVIDGYILAGGESCKEAISEAVTFAKKHSSKLALTLAATSIAENHRTDIAQLAQHSQMIIGNESEAMAFTGKSDFESAFQDLRAFDTDLLLSRGENGAVIFSNGQRHDVPGFKPERFTSTVGAGDSLAGSVLRSLDAGVSPERAVIVGNFIASRVIAQEEARLQGDVDSLFELVRDANTEELRALGWKG